MDKQVEAGSETLAGIQTFVARYPFPLDAFQLEAIAELAQGQSVMVAAPTGTGKTLVAEFAIWLAQQRNQRVIYTTPLKALSNQKYRDLREIYGYDSVGLVTGDIVEHSRASVVISENSGALAPNHLRHLGLATDIGKTFDTLSLSILHQVEFIIEKVVVLQGNSALLVHNQ